MSIKPVFKAEFEGDVFEIVAVNDNYHYRQMCGNDTIIEGMTPFLALAMQALFTNLKSWADDIDEGKTVCAGLEDES